MNSEKTILFISAGLLRPKKQDHLIARQHRYLNYGLLGLASIVHAAGYFTKVIHGHFETPENILNRAERLGMFQGSFPVFLSLPSSLSVDWAAIFAKLLRFRYPEKKLVVGGRWVVGDDGAWIRAKIPEIDMVVFGTAESRIVSLLSSSNWSHVQGNDLNNVSNNGAYDPVGPQLNYEILENRDEFQPSIEVSRGCGMGCSFCVEKDVQLSSLRSPKELLDSLEYQQREIFRRKIHPYFECSFFRPNLIWAKELVKQQQLHQTNISWRTESRVDSFTEEILTTLAQGGLKVIDVGLESASAQQLLRMGKTKRPDVYLKKASQLLRLCASLGILAKVNVLFYAGETEDTLTETRSWLNAHRAFFKGVSVNSVIIYRGPSSQRYLDDLSQYGARLVDPQSLDLRGFGSLHLSNSIDATHAEALCASVAREFMHAEDYYELKAFSYFPSHFTFADFLAIANKCKFEDLPFQIVSPPNYNILN